MKILLLDIETAPNLAYVWGLWKENIGHNQVVNNGYVLCWAAKWYGEKQIMFESCQSRSMLQRMHSLLDEADVVVHYYGSNFDIPTLQKEFVQKGMKPPSPFKQVDLCNLVKSAFRFPSNKLDYVCKALGLGTKVRHAGFELWVKCMANDPKAWKEMEKYNKHDVRLTEALYDRIRPYIKSHPNIGAFEDRSACPNCGSEAVQRRGVQVAVVRRYIRYQCQDCGAWFRGSACIKDGRPDRFTTTA